MTSLSASARALWTQFIALSAEGCEAVAGNFVRPRKLVIREVDLDRYAMNDPANAGGDIGFRAAVTGETDLPQEAHMAMKGAQIDVTLLPERFVFKDMSLPAQARSFLQQIVANQIDRLTPWTRDQALFGFAERGGADGKISVMLAATDRRRVASLLNLIAAGRPASVSIAATPGEGAPPIPLLLSASAAANGRASLQRAMAAGVIAMAALVALSQVYSVWRIAQYQDERETVDADIARRRVAMLQSGVMTDEGRAIFNRKIAGPFATVLVDRLSKILPDDTYLTDLELDGGKLRIAGQSPDATRLIDLLEHSGSVFDATFYAPTTRSRTSAGERFFIEATVGRRKGEKS